MMKKIAICGVWHVHAADYTNTAMKNAQVIGVWEEDKARREQFCKELNLPAFDSFEALLASDAEGVIVCSATDAHADLMIRLAEAGKHIFTEKVLALSVKDCERIAEAVEKNHVNFVISLVQKYNPAPLTVKQVIDSGELGKINYVRFRNCHSGSVNNWLPKHFYDAKECGGGAMIDLGAHGMYLIDWILGTPVTAKSVFTNACSVEAANALNTDRVEDNAVTVMGYTDGCIAVNETGFVSNHYPMSLEVGGEKGWVVFNNDGVTKTTDATEGRPVSVPLCEALPTPLNQFLSGEILEGCGMKEAIGLTRLMEMAYCG